MIRDIKRTKKHSLKVKKLLKRISKAKKQNKKDREEKVYRMFLKEYH